jgi:hypothetical protein
MLQTVPAHEQPDPVKISLFGPKAIVQVASLLTKLAEKASGLEAGRSAGMHGSIYTVFAYSLDVASQQSSAL